MGFDTFEDETKIIKIGEALLTHDDSVDFKAQYRALLDAYKALTKISQRLIRMSDRSEEALRRANEALEIAKEETREFIAIISHELRTPLAVLQSEVELLNEGIRQPTAENLASLGEEVTHFSRLINDMFELSLTDINALNYIKEELNLMDLLQKIVAQFEPMLTEKNITLRVLSENQPMLVWGDAQRIWQVFSNIIKNSCNYTDVGGRLLIESRVEKGRFVIEFADSAPGLSNQALDKIFNRFFRGESSRNRATGGAGLGMAICAGIMAEHQGEISAQHADLGGVMIRLIFPQYDKEAG